VMWKSTSSNG